MKKMLTVLLTLSALNAVNGGLAAPGPQAVPVSQAVVVADSGRGDALGYECLYTESAWQGLALPAEVMMALGDPGKITLKVDGLPANVSVALRPARDMNFVGLKVSRSDRTQGVRQSAGLTLGNPLTGYSYTVQAMIVGDQRPEK